MLQTLDHALYPAIEPHTQGYLPACDGHRIYFEEVGCPEGVPMVFLHGGPGSACGPRHRQFFNPRKVRAVLFDQRGCGRSAWTDLLHANTTQDLVTDMERLRQYLGIDRWWVVAGSWGAALGLAYASSHPQRCMGALLRGAFLARPKDIDWFFHGAATFMPDAWAALSPSLYPQGVHINLPVFDRLLSLDPAAAHRLASLWQRWEQALTTRSWHSGQLEPVTPLEAEARLTRYRVQSHYLQHQCFFPPAGLLASLEPMHALPVYLLHGRLDWVCRPEASWALHQHLPLSQLQWVDEAGHSPFESPMAQAWVRMIDHAATQTLD